MSKSKTLWQWYQTKEAIVKKQKEIEIIEEQEKALHDKIKEVEDKRFALQFSSNPDEELQKLLLEQELWLANKDMERFWEQNQNNKFALEQSIQQQQYESMRLEQELDESALSAYYQLAEWKNRPIVEVKNKACTGCFMLLTQNKINEWRRGGELVYCDQCGRILV